jgi:hypothetical protein
MKPTTKKKEGAWESLKGNHNARKKELAPPGMSKNVMYRVYYNMLQRCFNPKSVSYKYYADRGITVCQKWLEPNGQGFVNFLQDVGQRPEGKLLSGQSAYTLDRIDNDKNYEPGNVRWTDVVTQRNNQRTPEQMEAERINNLKNSK